MVFIQPKGSSTRLRMRCDTVWPAWRVGVPVDRRLPLPLAFGAAADALLWIESAVARLDLAGGPEFSRAR
jgi:hypothetical protein